MRSLLIILSGLWIAAAVRADFVVPTVATYGWDRPTVTGTAATFQAWDVFSTTTGPNAPQSVMGAGTGDTATVTTGTINTYKGFGGDATANWPTINVAGTPNVFDTNAATNGAFTTSGGNIYSPAGIVAPRIIIPNNIDAITGNNPNGITTLLLQIRMQGSDLVLASVKLFDPVSGLEVSPVSNTLLATQALGGFGGTLRDRLFVFEVTGNADLYTFNATAASSSLSLDRVAVDTYWDATAVPEPGLLGLLTLASMVAWRRHRARRVG